MSFVKNIIYAFVLGSGISAAAARQPQRFYEFKPFWTGKQIVREHRRILKELRRADN